MRPWSAGILLTAGLAGLVFGAGAFTFDYGEGLSSSWHRSHRANLARNPEHAFEFLQATPSDSV